MPRTVAQIDSEIAVYQNYLQEWIKPLLDTDISNRFTEAMMEGVIKDKIGDVNLWNSVSGYIIGNCNQFCIFDIGLNASNENDIVNAHEIGNESIHLGIEELESLNEFKLWRLNLISGNGSYNNIHTDDSHLVPYYPDNALKYVNYADPIFWYFSGFDLHIVEIENYFDTSLSYDTSYFRFLRGDVPETYRILAIDQKNITPNSQIQEIDMTTIIQDAGGITYLPDDKYRAYFSATGYDANLRTEIYRVFCSAHNWWADDTGEVAEWHNGDQGVYTGRRKIVSSWHIYEWILAEIEELERERVVLLGRTNQEIEAGNDLASVIDGIGFRNVYEVMFSEYPGVFNSVRLQNGYYTINDPNGYFDEASITKQFGYKKLETIRGSFETNKENANSVNFNRMLECFEFDRFETVNKTVHPSNDVDPSFNVQETVSIYRLNYDKYFTFNSKYRYYIATYFLSLRVDFSEPCEWDGLITFIIVVIITYFLGPEAGANSLQAFASYLAIFSLWVNFLDIGGSQDQKLLGYASIALGLYSAWKTGMLKAGEAGIGAATEEMARIQVEMAKRQVMQSVAMKSAITGTIIYLQESMESMKNEIDKDDNEDKDFEEEKDSKSSRNARGRYEDSFQFYPLERFLQKKEQKENKQNRQEFINYRLKENYGRH